MRSRKIFRVLLMCITLAACLTVNAGAVGAGDSGRDASAARASSRFNADIPGNIFFTANSSFPLDAGESVTIKASYSPSSASVDFGLVAPDGIFYYVTASGGSVGKTFLIEESGHYTLAIRNNSGAEISVSGRVSY